MESSTQADSLEKKLCGLGLIAAPLLLAVATFLWKDGEIGIVAGTIQVYSFVLWVVAFLGLFGMLREKMPRLSVVGILMGAYVSIGGNNWAMDGIYGEALRIASGNGPISRIALQEVMGGSVLLILILPGLLFPITLIITGIALIRKKVVPLWVGSLLVIGAVAFPVSRVPRIEWIAHIADLLLLVPLAWLGWRYLTGSQTGVAKVQSEKSREGKTGSGDWGTCVRVAVREPVVTLPASGGSSTCNVPTVWLAAMCQA